MSKSEAEVIAKKLDEVADTYHCSWLEARRRTGLPDPESMNIDASMSLESDSNKTPAHFDSSEVAINAIINEAKRKLKADGLSKR